MVSHPNTWWRANASRRDFGETECNVLITRLFLVLLTLLSHLPLKEAIQYGSIRGTSSQRPYGAFRGCCQGTSRRDV